MEIFYFWFLGVNSQLSAGFAGTARTRGGKKRRRNREMLHLVQSSAAIAGSLQRLVPPSCPGEPPNQALGAKQTSPFQQKHKGSPVASRIWDFSRPEWLQVLPGQTDRLPRFPCWQQACHGVSGSRNALVCCIFSEDTAKLALFSQPWTLFVLRFVSCGTALVTLVLPCQQQHPELLKWAVEHSWAPLGEADLLWGE